MKNSDDVSDIQGDEAAQSGATAAGQHQHPESNDVEPDLGERSLEGAGSASERRQTASTSEAVSAAVAVTEHRAEEVAKAAKASVDAATQVQDAAETAAEAAAKAKLEAEAKVAASVSSTDGIFALGIALLVVAFAVFSAILGPNIFGTGSDVLRGANSAFRGDNSASMSIIATTVRDLTAVEKTTLQPADQVWHVKGQVLFENNPADGAIVYAVLKDHWGNEYTSDVVKNTAEEGFKIDLNLGKYEESLRPRAEEVLVFAGLTQQEGGWFSGGGSIRASEELRPEPTSGSRWSRKSAAPFLSALIIFGFSILLSMVPCHGPKLHASKYYSVALLALIFTAWMIYFISVTMQTLGGSSKNDEVISLGFAHVFFGGYVEDANDEWILSLTTPEVRTGNVEQRVQRAATADVAAGAGETGIAFRTSGRSAATGVPDEGLDNPRGMVREIGTPPSPVEETVPSRRNISSGFGAPLWLLLLSVVGASAFAICTAPRLASRR